MKKLIRILLVISVIVFANVTPAFATNHQGEPYIETALQLVPLIYPGMPQLTTKVLQVYM